MKKIVLDIMPYLLVSLGFILVFVFIQMNSQRTLENQTYGRFLACALSVPADERNQARIELCWDRVQEDTGVTVRRYDK